MDYVFDTTKADHVAAIDASTDLPARFKGPVKTLIAAAGIPDGPVEVSVAVGPSEAGWLVVRVAPYRKER